MEVRCDCLWLWDASLKPFNPPQIDGIWLWVYYNTIPIYPILYVLKGDPKP